MKIRIAKLALVSLITGLIGCGPGDGSKELTLARQAYELSDLTRAEKLLTASLEIKPENVDAILLLARVKLDLGNLTDAGEIIKSAISASPDDVDVKLVHAHILWHAKEYERSYELFKSIADDTKLSAQLRAQGWAGIGVVEMARESDLHLARIAFMRAIRFDRMNAAAWYHLGLVYRDFGYNEAALEQFDIFVRLETSASPRVQRVQRSVIPALKELIARETANRAGVSKRDSAASAAALAKAEAHWKKGQYTLAISEYKKATSADPLSYPAALGLAKALLKTDKTKEGRRKALESYRNACSLRPGAIQTFVTAGELAASMNYHAQSLEIFSRAIAASPASIQCIDGLIRAMWKTGAPKSVSRAYQLYRESLSIKNK